MSVNLSGIPFEGKSLVKTECNCIGVIDPLNTELEWKYNTNDIIEYSPALYGNIVLLEAGEIFYGLDKNNGKIKWKYKTLNKNGIKKLFYKHDFFSNPQDYYHSSHVIYNNLAFFGSLDGCIYGINIKTGKKSVFFKTDFPVRSSSAIYDDTLYFGNWVGIFYAVNLKNQEGIMEICNRSKKA